MVAGLTGRALNSIPHIGGMLSCLRRGRDGGKMRGKKTRQPEAVNFRTASDRPPGKRPEERLRHGTTCRFPPSGLRLRRPPVINNTAENFIQDVMYEAAYRIRAASEMLETIRDPSPDASDTGGYDF